MLEHHNEIHKLFPFINNGFFTKLTYVGRNIKYKDKSKYVTYWFHEIRFNVDIYLGFRLYYIYKINGECDIRWSKLIRIKAFNDITGITRPSSEIVQIIFLLEEKGMKGCVSRFCSRRDKFLDTFNNIMFISYR